MPEKKPDLRITLIKIAGTIIVTALGVYGTIFSTLANNKASQSSASQEEVTKAILDQINKVLLPRLQHDLDNIAVTLKEVGEDGSAARERLARVEAIVEMLARRTNTRTADVVIKKEMPRGVQFAAGRERLPQLNSTGILQLLEQKTDGIEEIDEGGRNAKAAVP